MKNIVKKIAIYSMIGMMQIGFSASVIEASPLHNDTQGIVQLNGRDHNNDERQREHDRREREENERHNREMQRRDHESDRDWHDRQKRENKRHNNALREIAALLIGIAIGSSNN
jgi:TATA-binding protein-associated factor Taf7